MSKPFHPARRHLLKLTLWGLLCSASALSISYAHAQAVATEEAPVDFTADQVAYDDISQTVTALGSVEIVQNGKIVKADRVTYSLITESVGADGNVIIMDTNGDVHFADHIDFKDDLKNGYVKKLKTVLADGSRFTAEEGRRKDGTTIEMTDATYTPCEPCKLDPDAAPLWQIRAGRVTHDDVEHDVSYKDATFEIYGKPIVYLPYFKHPDGTIKQKSGFLTPFFSLDSQQGLGVEPRYYWAIDPTQDATFATRIYTQQAPLLLGEYRKRFENASIEFSGSTTYSGRNDSIGGERVTVDDELRGHLFSEGLWDINEKWRAGFNAQISSDDQYLRQYDISNDDVLQNEVYAERFDNRDYAVARILAFQDVRVSDRATDQPNIFPEVQAGFYGDPNNLLGGRWNLDMSALGLTRDGRGQDVVRGSVNVGWERRDVLDFGLVNTFTANARADGYTTPSRDEELGGDGDSRAGRFYPALHNVTSYPLIKNLEAAQVLFEPTVSLTATSNVDNDSDIPNEDSQDVQIDTSNIFEADRFPGLDRVEDRSHVTYGARTGIYTPDGSQAEFFIGQSYRLSNEDNPFPRGSGLDEQRSNIVGHVISQYQNLYNLNYRFQLGSENLQSEQHELTGTAIFGDVDIFAYYLYARALEGTDLSQSREQVYGGIGWRFDDEWKIRTAARYDLGQENEGIRLAELGLDYIGQCLTVSTTARKNYTDDETGESSTEVFLRFGFKNLGEFATGE
jgi:LPS-assembly protein